MSADRTPTVEEAREALAALVKLSGEVLPVVQVEGYDAHTPGEMERVLGPAKIIGTVLDRLAREGADTRERERPMGKEPDAVRAAVSTLVALCSPGHENDDPAQWEANKEHAIAELKSALAGERAPHPADWSAFHEHMEAREREPRCVHCGQARRDAPVLCQDKPTTDAAHKFAAPEPVKREPDGWADDVVVRSFRRGPDRSIVTHVKVFRNRGVLGPEAVSVFFGAAPEPVERVTLGRALDEAVAWADATFGAGPGREASKAEHLRREAVELAKSGGTDPGEMADVAILLAHLAAGQGVDLAEAVRAKLDVLREREWGEPDAHGVVEHVRAQEEPEEQEPDDDGPTEADIDAFEAYLAGLPTLNVDDNTLDILDWCWDRFARASIERVHEGANAALAQEEWSRPGTDIDALRFTRDTGGCYPKRLLPAVRRLLKENLLRQAGPFVTLTEAGRNLLAQEDS